MKHRKPTHSPPLFGITLTQLHRAVIPPRSKRVRHTEPDSNENKMAFRYVSIGGDMPFV